MGHTPEFPSSLSDDCPDVIGSVLALRCVNGHGWSLASGTGVDSIEDPQLFNALLEIIPEFFVALTRPRSGIAGRVVRAPDGYDFHRFVAIIMSDGCDYDFSGNVAPAWRVCLGNGELDYVEDKFLGRVPIMTGTGVYRGWGWIAIPEYWAKDRRRGTQPSGLG